MLVMRITVEEVESSRGRKKKTYKKNKKNKVPASVGSQAGLELIWERHRVLQGQCIVLKSSLSLQFYAVLHYTTHMSKYSQLVLGLYTISLSADGLDQNILASSPGAAVPECTTGIMRQKKGEKTLTEWF